MKQASDVYLRACIRPIPMSTESRWGCFQCVGSWMGQGDSGQQSKPAGLTNLL